MEIGQIRPAHYTRAAVRFGLGAFLFSVSEGVMKLAKVFAIALCSLLLIAATKGTEVTQEQIGQFQIGTASVLDIESKLGQPQRSGPTPDGGTAVDYILMDEAPNGASFVPFARLAAGAMNLHEVRVEFQFDPAGHLALVKTDQRDLVCPHKACGQDQMNQPWTPSPTQGD